MRIAHVFAHAATNLGDIYLKRATQEAFATAFPSARFTDVEVRRIYNPHDVDELNRHDLVVLGGGGLLLRDTFPNQLSDWQWGCSTELLRRIEAPIAVYAIGYNRFRRQEDFDRSIFEPHMAELAERSVFFSLRNSGSVRAIRGYLPASLRERVRLNPCPSLLFPRVVPDRPLGRKKVGLLLAGDRLSRRHPDIPRFLEHMASLLRTLTRHAELTIVAHQPQDLWYVEHLRAVPVRVVDLIGASPEEAVACYSNLDVMIGDRGHAQMIPFALGCRIVSLVSHDKLAWFLQDVRMEDHGVEESDPDLEERVLSLVFPEGPDDYADRRAEAMRAIARNVYGNLREIVEAASVHTRSDLDDPLDEPELPPPGVIPMVRPAVHPSGPGAPA